MGALAEVEFEDDVAVADATPENPSPADSRDEERAVDAVQLEWIHRTGEGVEISAFHPLAGPQATD